MTVRMLVYLITLEDARSVRGIIEILTKEFKFGWVGWISGWKNLLLILMTHDPPLGPE